MLMLAAALVAACAGGNGNNGSSGPDAGTSSGMLDTNPDGVPYPSPPSGYGHTPRSGATAGSVVTDFKFRGYLDGDTSKGIQTISLSQFYDPCAKRYRLIHISVAAVWCQPCNQETDAIVAAKAKFDASKIALIQALDDGPTQGVAATQHDLDFWVSTHHSNFTEVLDPGLANLAGFFDPAAIPWNADIDARTMELLTSDTGWAGDVDAAIQASEQAIPAMPGYPLSVACP
jgi:hypothetical protein